MPDWDKLYAEQAAEDSQAAMVLSEHVCYLPEQGRALDFACGLGGNAQALAQQGLQVEAVDKSTTAIKKLQQLADEKNYPIKAWVQDLENNPLNKPSNYDVICVSYFLHRPTLARLYDYLKPGGLLFYQTFSGAPLEIEGGGVKGPSNPAFRLKKGELLNVFSEMECIYYRQDPVSDRRLDTGSNLHPDQVQFIAMKKT